MITIVRDVYRPETCVHEDFDGALIDFLTDKFPNGFGSDKSAVFVNQELLPVEDYDSVISNDDNVVIITTIPETGFDTAFWVSLAVQIIFAAVTYFTAPKPPKTGAKPSRTYDINSGQNIPALGQPIVEHFGQTWFYPDVASQPYTFYANNEQYLYEILLLGAGEYRVDGLRFGDTDFESIPAGIIEYRVFPPSEVQARYGYIASQFNVQEDVITSSDVQGIDLAKNPNSSWFGKKAQTDDKYITGTEAPLKFAIGETVKLYNTYNTGGGNQATATITNIVNKKMYFDTLPVIMFGSNWWQVVKMDDDGWRGWFDASIVGKQADVIAIDITFPNGLYSSDSVGDLYTYTVYLIFQIQLIDDNNNDIGPVIEYSEAVSALTKSTLRKTFSYGVTLGRYKVRVKRDMMDDAQSRVQSQSLWQGLKAFCYNTPNEYAYGDVTLLAVKVKASNQLSSRSDLISVQATRILPTVESDFTVALPTVNPVDAFAHIVREIDPAGIDVDSLKALGVKWANTNGFNYRFTDQDVVYSALQKIAYSHRASPEAYAYKLSMRQDVVKPFDQFIVSNEQIIKDTYKTGVMLAQTSGIIDGYRIGYQDPTGVRQLFVVYPSTALAPTEVQLDGCTDSNTAIQQGAYLYTKYLTQGRVVEFSTEWDALVFNVGDRISVLNSVVDKVSTARVLSAVGQVLTLDAILEAPNVQVRLRDQYGAPSDILNGYMTGNTLTLTDPIPFTIFGTDSGQEATTVMLATTKDYARSFLVQSVTPDTQSVAVTAVSYSPEPYLYPIPNEL